MNDNTAKVLTALINSPAVASLLTAIATFILFKAHSMIRGADRKATVANERIDVLMNGGGDAKVDARLLAHGLIKPNPSATPFVTNAPPIITPDGSGGSGGAAGVPTPAALLPVPVPAETADPDKVAQEWADRVARAIRDTLSKGTPGSTL